MLVTSTLQPEGTLDVDVPELVGPRSLIGRATIAVDPRSRGAVLGEQRVDRMVTHRVDVAPAELGREALAVPVRQQTHRDDGQLDPGRQPLTSRTTWPMAEGLEATVSVGTTPAIQAGPAGTEREGCTDALLVRGPDTADPEAQSSQVLTGRWSWGSPTPGREEQEPGAFLIRVAEWTTMGVGACARHVATLLTSLDSMFH